MLEEILPLRLETGFVAFLFDADHPELGNWYSPRCEQPLLLALQAKRDKLPASFRILRGDVLVHNLASRLLRYNCTASPLSCCEAD